MKYKLKHIAAVQTGSSFRSRLEPLSDGNVRVVQMKDLGQDNRVDLEALTRVSMRRVKAHHLLHLGDVVLRSRSHTNSAVLIDTEVEDAIVAAPLIRIRATSKNVLPSYLCWFINQPSTQSYFQTHATGSSARIIGKHVVENMEVFVPSLEKQKQIVEISQLMAKEQSLIRQLAQKRKQYFEKLLFRFAHLEEI